MQLENSRKSKLVIRNFRNLLLLGAFVSVVFQDTHVHAVDVIQAWNRVLSQTMLDDVTYQNPGMASRSLAMTNLAMYDAVNSIDQNFETFYSHGAAPSNASAEAAALRAGYRVVSNIYPGQQAQIDMSYNSILATLPNDASTTAGISFGDMVGQTVTMARDTDGYMNIVPYTPTNVVGHWQPDPLNPGQAAWGPEWGEIQPFSLMDTAAMMPPSMPTLTSQEYTDAFNEVKSLGSLNSATRTADQTEIGLFWAYDRLGMGTPMRMFIQIMDEVSENEGNTFEENARMYAMASTSIADAGIVAWDSKFEFDFWRPISGIRQADMDGNPDTMADPTWVPLGAPGGVLDDGTVIDDFTPPFPTYVSGHASFGGALFKSLEHFYGTDAISFSLTSDEVPGVTRNFDSFSQAMEENGRSRVYLGIHWDFDDFEARSVGGNVANYVSATHFQAVPEPSTVMMVALIPLSLGLLRRRRR